MSPLLLLPIALAAPPPSVGGRVDLAVARGAGEAAPAAGLSLDGELAAADRVRVGAELGLQAGGQGSSGGLLLAEAAWYVNTPWRRGPALAGTTALGFLASAASAPVGAVGARVDLGLSDRWGLRIQTEAVFDLTRGPVGVRLGVGPERLFPRPEPPPPPPPVLVGFEPADARAWVEHPGCGWHPVQELLVKPGDLDPQTSLVLHARGYLPAHTTLDHLADTRMVRAPEQGGLVIVGWPGDRARVDGHAVELNRDGVAVIQAAPGPLEVDIEGGGRRDEELAAVADGYVTWVRASRPRPLIVNFDQGDSALGSADLRDVALLAQQAGGWRFQVQGSASPEGDRDYNIRLAQQRAEVVRGALISAGLPADTVVLAAPLVQLYGDPAALRNVVVTPLSPEGTP